MVNKYNFETIDLLRRNIKDWRVEDEVQFTPLYVYHQLTFDSLSDKTERNYFHGIPTTSSLQPVQVDRYRDVAAKLLFASPDIQRLVRDMDGKEPEPSFHGENR